MVINEVRLKIWPFIPGNTKPFQAFNNPFNGFFRRPLYIGILYSQDQLAAGFGERPSDPDPRVTSRGSDLQRAGVLALDDEVVKKLPVRRRNVHVSPCVPVFRQKGLDFGVELFVFIPLPGDGSIVGTIMFMMKG